MKFASRKAELVMLIASAWEEADAAPRGIFRRMTLPKQTPLNRILLTSVISSEKGGEPEEAVHVPENSVEEQNVTIIAARAVFVPLPGDVNVWPRSASEGKQSSSLGSARSKSSPAEMKRGVVFREWS